MNTKTYTLNELVTHNLIDSWVEAMSALADRYGHEVDGYNPDTDCPAEYECEFRKIAEEHSVKFGHLGQILSSCDERISWKEWLSHLLEVVHVIAEERRDLTECEYSAYESDSGMLAVDLSENLTDADVDKIISLINEIANRKEA